MAGFIESTLGIELVVLFLCTLLYGLGLLQCWLYFQWYRDTWRIKTAVLVLLFFETFQIATLFARTYNYLITNFGNLDDIMASSWVDLAQQLAIYTSALIVQFYFAHVLYIFNRKYIYCSLIILALAIISLGGGIAQGVLGRTTHYPNGIAETKITVTIQSAAALACDIAITTSLCIAFRHRKTGMRSTNSMLHTLTVYAIGRGVLTAIAAAMNFIFFLALPATFYFVLGLLLSGKLYMNSMLFSLNSRQHVRNHPNHEPSMVEMDFLSSNTTQEPAQDGSAKLRPLEPCSSGIADATDSGEKSTAVFSTHSYQPTTQSSAC